jgi:exopolysaccharide biosynthesis polyprenyl glycosylphosphotransferase
MTIERTLIVGTGAPARALLEAIAAQPRCALSVVGMADDGDGGAGVPFSDRVCGPLDELDAIIQRLQPDRIIVAMGDRRGRLPMSALVEARVRGVQVEDAANAYERVTGKVAIESLNPSALVASTHFKKTYADLVLGHALSLIVSAAALVLLMPLYGLIALAIAIDSGRPILFVHDRAGVGGRRFRLLKFRTMRPSGTPTSEWVRDNGDRVTRVGALLRKYRLDELPQLINVLCGDMNLVGPRPHPVTNVDLFAREIPYYSVRASVRPGLTGWAQVHQGYANDLAEETEKMRYDLYYIKHMSLWLDLRILWRTIGIVLGGREVMAPRAAAPNVCRPASYDRLRFGQGPLLAFARHATRLPRGSERNGARVDSTGPV